MSSVFDNCSTVLRERVDPPSQPSGPRPLDPQPVPFTLNILSEVVTPFNELKQCKLKYRSHETG